MAPEALWPCVLFPSVGWWAGWLKHPAPVFSGVSRQDQRFRNRYRIATASGELTLSVPLKGGRRMEAPFGALKIDYQHSWQRQHWGALYSAYGRAPYFEHYGPELKDLIFREYESLLALNLTALEWLRRSMRLEPAISLSPEAAPAAVFEKEIVVGLPEYHQVRQDQLGFLPGLSAIDLLMVEGPYSGRYLTL